jgi:hypothetical protein
MQLDVYQQDAIASMQGAQKLNDAVKPVTRWKKFEYFNFPVPESNDLFDQLQRHFVNL